MKYELNTTDVFDDWLTRLDGSIKRRLAQRLFQVECGNFGDYKALTGNLFELRCFFGGGLRLYYSMRDNRIVLLLVGGDKSTQSRDIDRATEMLNQIGE